MPTKDLIQIMLILEHVDKTIYIKIHEILMWFYQPYLYPYLMGNHSIISYKTLQNIEIN